MHPGHSNKKSSINYSVDNILQKPSVKKHIKKIADETTTKNMESAFEQLESTAHMRTKGEPAGMYDNPLHKFASYNTLFTLSGLQTEEMDSLAFLDNTPHDVIARSGGIGNPNVSKEKFDDMEDNLTLRKKYAYRHGEKMNEGYDQNPSFNILSAGHDIFFENVNIISTVGPNAERGLANFTKMEFEMHEPFGVTLIEKIRSACYVNGFHDYQSAPLLFTIQWKGWDEHGRDKALGAGANTLIRKIPILITRIEFDVAEGGARYRCVAVPFGDLAHDDRYKFPRKAMKVSCDHMGKSGESKFYDEAGDFDWMKNSDQNQGAVGKMTTEDDAYEEESWIWQMEQSLKTQMKDEIEEKVRSEPDFYRFVVHDEVLSYGKEWLRNWQLTHHLEHREWYEKFGDWLGGKSKPTIKINHAEGGIDLGTALPKFFEDAIRTLTGYSQLAERFWYTWGYNQLKKAGNEPAKGDEYKATVDYFRNSDGKFKKDLEQNQYVNWFMIKPSIHTHTEKFDQIRKVHPKTITYYAMPTKIHILKFVKPGVSFGNIDWNLYVKKQYDYIYTGQNIDVQSLKIDYKTAYFMRNVRPFFKTSVVKGDYERFVSGFTDTMNRVFGQETHPEPNLPLTQEPSHVNGKNTFSDTNPLTNKSQEFYDYLTNPQADMMRIELEILGDPQYICQDLYTPLKKVGDKIYKFRFSDTYSRKWGSFNAEQYQPLVKVNYRLPDEMDVKNEGLMFTGYQRNSGSENLFFNGVYQVTKVESRIDQGQFTQILSLVRLNNQKGKGMEAIEIGTGFNEYFDKKARNNLKLTTSQENLVNNLAKASFIKGENMIQLVKPEDLE